MTAPRTYSDEYLHHWGEVFAANAAIRRWYEERGLGDVAFESFLTDPQAVMEAITYGLPVPLPDGQEFYPLLSAQEAVRLRLILMELAENPDSVLAAPWDAALVASMAAAVATP